MTLETGRSECTLVDFGQFDGYLRLQLSGSCRASGAFAFGSVPTNVSDPLLSDADELGTTTAVSSNPRVNVVDIYLSVQHEKLDREYSIVVYFDEVRETRYLELVRQNEGWLKRTFSFSRPGGYTILGRRSGVGISLPQVRLRLGEVPATIPRRKRTEQTEGNEFQVASDVTRVMHSRPIGSGPANGRHLLYSVSMPEKQLERIWRASPPVQCTGFRDVWLGLMTQRGFKVRAVEANDESPASSSLITYGHSCAEIWVPTMQQWVLYDPWFGGLMCSLDGVPLSAEMLHNLVIAESSRLEHVEFAWDVHSVVRYVRQESSAAKSIRVQPSRIQILAPSLGPLGLQPPYSSYFRHIVLRDVHIRSHASGIAEIVCRATRKLLSSRSPLSRAS